MELFGNYLGRKSGSRLSVEVRDGARYRKYFLGTLEIFKKKKPLWLQGLFGGRVGECTEVVSL